MAAKAILVLFQDREVAWIRALSESRGSQWFRPNRMHNPHTGLRDDDLAPWDFPHNAEGPGAEALATVGVEGFRKPCPALAAGDHARVRYFETDLAGPNPLGAAWEDVPVSGVSSLASVRWARAVYDGARAAQRHYLLQPRRRP
jgi:3D-(3,5/4)-trihydroxycyclohexane-1,2-dione acylhydrolase (decyclizing)